MARQLPDRWHDLGAFIREQRSSARLSLRRLSELAGISNPYLSQIERGLRKPSAEILQQIAKALRISAETLYVQAGILEPGSGEHDLPREILADPHLTEDQKQALVRIYLSFRHEHDLDEGADGEVAHDVPGERGSATPAPPARPARTGVKPEAGVAASATAHGAEAAEDGDEPARATGAAGDA
jgi:transcriptional regulator with XRE-family HTH domain